MERMVGKILRTYGRELRLVRGQEEQRVVGFFQPITGKAQRMGRLCPGPLGLESGSGYIYIGPPEHPLQQGDLLELDGRTYQVQSAREIFGTARPAYVWAMCVEKGGELNWESNG